MLIGLISNRPTVFAATMGSFPDLRSLAIRVVHNEFKRYIKHSADEIKFDSDSAVKITLCCESLPDSKEEVVEATLPLSLLKSACVLLSIWLETDRDDVDNKAVGGLVRMLMRPQEAENSVESGENKVDGLASACMADSGKSAIPVESVSATRLIGLPNFTNLLPFHINDLLLFTVGNACQISE